MKKQPFKNFSKKVIVLTLTQIQKLKGGNNDAPQPTNIISGDIFEL